MKKTGLYLIALLGLGFASCDDTSDLGIQQTNPQEAIMSANGITVDYGTPIAGSAINLGSYKDGNIDVIKLVKAEDLPEGATINFSMEVAPTSDFSNAETLNVVNGAVSANEWDAAFKTLIGKTPLATTNWIRFAVYAEQGTQETRIGGADTWYATKEISVTPYDLQLPVESSYYFVGAGAEYVMDHTAKHVYDDPSFTYVFDVTSEQAAAGYNWTIKSASGKSYGVSETGDPAELSGNLEEGAQAGNINVAGTYKITVNMLDLTYNITLAYEKLYTPGNANGWGDWTNQMYLTTTDYKNYAGYVYVDTQFKLCGTAGWDINWGVGSEEGTLASDGGNIQVATNGLYYVEVNLSELTYKLTYIETIGVIGGFNGWGSSVALTPSADYKTWTGDVTFGEDTTWKFRCNNGWDYNLGGTFDNLVQNGDNLSSAAGTYTITLNLGTLPYSCTAVAK